MRAFSPLRRILIRGYARCDNVRVLMRVARRYLRFMMAMKSMEISLGHAFSHSPWFVQLPGIDAVTVAASQHPKR